MTTTRKLTAAKQAKALTAAAEWMGRKGWGTDLGNGKIGPAPTGDEAARRGDGPMLNPTWDWPGEPTPTIILEGGPDDWAYRIWQDAKFAATMTKLSIYCEPYAGYALCLYPDPA